jgi:hypothetical protein
VGRQHHLAVEVAGKQFELKLALKPEEAAQEAAAAAAAGGGGAAARQQRALPMPPVRRRACAASERVRAGSHPSTTCVSKLCPPHTAQPHAPH